MAKEKPEIRATADGGSIGATDGTQHAIPRDTTPTWESELLISGAVVFAMFQLPALLEDSFTGLVAKLAGSWRTVSMFGFLYAKIVVFALIATFLIHLITRGFWIALIGLRSVFPHGIKWEGLSGGPNYVEVTRKRTITLPALIERVDNFASLIFAFGALLVSMSVFTLAMSVIIIVLSQMVSTYLLDGRHEQQLLLAGIAVFVVPVATASVIDRLFGKRIAHDALLARILRGVFAFYSRIPLSTAILLVFTTNIGRRRGMLMVMGGLYLLIGLAVVDTMARRGELRLDSYAYIASEGQERRIQAVHYADQRRLVDRYATAAFVQSDMLKERYARLFVPYVPERHTPAIEAQCPGVSAHEIEDDARESSRRDAILTCVAEVLQVQLDGTAIADARFDFAIDPSSGLKGFVSYVALTTLSAGRHEITLRRPARVRTGRLGQTQEEESVIERIAFWR